MSTWGPTRTPRGSFQGLLPLTEHLRTAGHDVEAILARAGLPASVEADDRRLITPADTQRLWEAAIEATGDVTLPLAVASSVKRGSLGVFGYLAATAESGRDGFDRTSRLVGLMAEGVEVRLSFETAGGLVSLHYSDWMRPGRATGEYSVGIMVTMSRMIGTPDAGPIEARFTHAAPPHAEAYERILGVPPVFDAANNGVVFPTAMFDEPNPEADSVLRQLIEEHATRMLDAIPHEEELADRVRGAIKRRLAGGTPSVDEIAGDLHQSARTLRRHLEREGTTYRAILDGLRRDLALEALDQEGCTVDEAAQRTGFSDASAFHKAFRRWTGRSPARPSS